MLNLGGEIIYPEPEVTGSTLILMLANGFTFVMAEILSHLTTNFNIIYRIVPDKGSRSVRTSVRTSKVQSLLESCLLLV